MIEHYESNEAEIDAICEMLRVAAKLPCCDCIVKTDPDCKCDRHRLPNGKEMPHHDSRTIAEVVKERHPIDPNRFAVKITRLARDVARGVVPVEDRQAKEFIETFVSLAEPRTSEWEKEPPIAHLADPKIEAEVKK